LRSNPSTDRSKIVQEQNKYFHFHSKFCGTKPNHIVPRNSSAKRIVYNKEKLPVAEWVCLFCVHISLYDFIPQRYNISHNQPAPLQLYINLFAHSTGNSHYFYMKIEKYCIKFIFYICGYIMQFCIIKCITDNFSLIFFFRLDFYSLKKYLFYHR
jgi:hypothetical protein